ncbi:MAG: FeoB-associated Cys-rich membrane protein [Desulfobulbaceae bacterium]|nr:FeoB-associated Cys-rich membrane protein [Desulfobulbaceae bacterium]
MIESLLVWIIIFLAAFFIARKFYRQFKNSNAPDSTLSCNSGCCGCSETACHENKSQK